MIPHQNRLQRSHSDDEKIRFLGKCSDRWRVTSEEAKQAAFADTRLRQDRAAAAFQSKPSLFTTIMRRHQSSCGLKINLAGCCVVFSDWMALQPRTIKLLSIMRRQQFKVLLRLKVLLWKLPGLQPRPAKTEAKTGKILNS